MRAAAGATTTADAWNFVEGGSGGEHTMRENGLAFDRVRLLPRVAVDVAGRTARTRLLGLPVPVPLAVAPMAYQTWLHPDGEVATAAAAAAAGVPFVVSMMASRTVEDIAATGAATVMQLYWLRDRGLFRELIGRAEAAGCAALMLTVDVPLLGRRLRDMRGGLVRPATVVAANLGGAGGGPGAGAGRAGRSEVALHTKVLFDPSLSWADVAWVRSVTRLPLVLKGILDPDDAALAVDAGADAVVVSNHGGRQLDGAVATATALPAVVDAVAGRCEVLVDSGIRGGVDVLKALALGAAGVLVGRPLLWGLAAGGAPGVTRVFDLISEELHEAMALAGCPDVDSARRLRTSVAGGGC
ncbi:alpha-hydroxy acid oxidase [Polymorphospora sp. NPDC050346]|uniref:alpha-hydroxy acid oxidase n=1 Tax=Polymorphospora sp. NPDC050346 TaxID=3155780 RepID=UPI0033EF44C8